VVAWCPASELAVCVLKRYFHAVELLQDFPHLPYLAMCVRARACVCLRVSERACVRARGRACVCNRVLRMQTWPTSSSHSSATSRRPRCLASRLSRSRRFRRRRRTEAICVSTRWSAARVRRVGEAHDVWTRRRAYRGHREKRTESTSAASGCRPPHAPPASSRPAARAGMPATPRGAAATRARASARALSHA